MAAYQNAGPTATSMSVVPATQPDTSAFDRLQAAFRAGVITQQDLTKSLALDPAAMAVSRQDAELKMQVAPLLQDQQIRLNELSLGEGQAKLDAFKLDPTGVRGHIAKQMAEFGLQPTGDPVADGATLRAAIAKAKDELNWKQTSNEAAAAGVDPLPNETPEQHTRRAWKELPGLKKQKDAEETNQKELLNVHKSNQGRTTKQLPIPKTLEEAFAMQAQLNAEEKAEENEKALQKENAKGPSESESKRAVYLAEIEQSNKTLAELETDKYKPQLELWDMLLPEVAAARLARSSKGNTFLDARNKWIEAVLRERSGASIQPSEYSKAGAQYFPQPGDTDAQIKYKKELRTAAENTIRATIQNPGLRKFFDATGKQFTAPETPDGQTPAPVSLAPGVQPAMYKGKYGLFKQVDGKWFEVNADGSLR